MYGCHTGLSVSQTSCAASNPISVAYASDSLSADVDANRGHASCHASATSLAASDSSAGSMMISREKRPDVSDPTVAMTRSSPRIARSEEHTSELQSLTNLVCRLLLE